MNKVNPELIDDENPEWTAEDFRRARPAAEVLPADVYASLLAMNRRAGVGRPKAAVTKVHTSIRLSPDVLAGLKATGRGWQTRADEALRAWVKAHPKGA